jgi:hypothetical protein
MKEWALWPWSGESSETNYVNEHAGALSRLLINTLNSRNGRSFRLSEESLLDIKVRIEHSRLLLGKSEDEMDKE